MNQEKIKNTNDVIWVHEKSVVSDEDKKRGGLPANTANKYVSYIPESSLTALQAKLDFVRLALEEIKNETHPGLNSKTIAEEALAELQGKELGAE